MSEVVSLAEAKSMLEIAHTAQDTLVQTMIDGAEADVEDFCGIKFGRTDRHEDLDGGGFGLVPTERPVLSVTTVSDNQTGEALDSSEYTLVDDVIYRDDGARWDEEPPGRWCVWYVGGYVVGTATIKFKNVILDLVYRMYHNRGGKSGQGAAGYRVDWAGNDSDLARRLRRFRHGAAVIG